MVDVTSIIEGTVKFRDGKKWKSRWCVMRKLSPVADCLHLQLYRDSKDRYKKGPTKASLSLEHFLGIETGFTLDKESNTIAIICEDVIVVLAFDTRERLMQWQVKISTNLGDDIQYLVLVSSSPAKAKVSSGPARMHIQDHRFCLTTGVPPRLAGLWKIGHMRRYGVIDGRFCFEGGSSCGKGEGLYVFVTDQSNEITHTLKLASQGRLIIKKRPMAKKQTSSIIHEETCLLSSESNLNGNFNCTCSVQNTSYWPSQESRDTESNYACGETGSVLEGHDVFNSDLEMARMSKKLQNIPRCMSCMSKLGAPSMSRSSTLTGTPCNELQPVFPVNEYTTNKNVRNISRNQILDCLSLDSHGSSNSSDYSIPKVTMSKMKQSQSVMESNWYEKNFPLNRIRTSCNCFTPAPNRPPKFTKTLKPPMPLPTTTQPVNQFGIGPYENYDVPKISYKFEEENVEKLKQVADTVLGNYDMPITVIKNLEASELKQNCSCNKIVSWNCMTLPYCRRGNGIENTGIAVDRFRIENQNRSIIRSSENAIYATVDMTKKISRRITESDLAQYDKDVRENKSNYMNLQFERSLEFYENSKQVLVKVNSTPQLNEQCFPHSDIKQTHTNEIIKVCHKCLNHKTYIKRSGKSCENLVQEILEKEDDYMMMEPNKSSLNPESGIQFSLTDTFEQLPAPPILFKSDLLKRILNEKSASNPSLRENVIDLNRNNRNLCDQKLEGIELSDDNQIFHDENFPKENSVLSEADDVSGENSQTSQTNYMRHAISVPFKGHTRDSSSSNDSGVSVTSLKNLELPLSNSMSVKKYQRHILPTLASEHSSLPRRSKSVDPLGEISFQFQIVKLSEKCTSAEAEVPICPSKSEGYEGNVSGQPFIDSRSTSSGTSDMSDYIETLSYSSHSSTDTAEAMRLMHHQPTSTLRPRSGKEYQNIDRSLITLSQPISAIYKPVHQQPTPNLNLCLNNYTNITPVLDRAGGTSPCYQSGDTPLETLKNTDDLYIMNCTESTNT